MPTKCLQKHHSKQQKEVIRYLLIYFCTFRQLVMQCYRCVQQHFCYDKGYKMLDKMVERDIPTTLSDSPNIKTMKHETRVS